MNRRVEGQRGGELHIHSDFCIFSCIILKIFLVNQSNINVQSTIYKGINGALFNSVHEAKKIFDV